MARLAVLIFGLTLSAFAYSNVCEPTSIIGGTPQVEKRAPASPYGVHYGNGGDVLVQYSEDQSDILQIHLLDYWEARFRRIEIDLGAPELSIMAKLEIAFERWERLDVGRVERFRQWLQEFERESCFMRDIRLEDRDDSDHDYIPDGPGWKIEQIAIQREPDVPEDPRYIVDKDLWDELDNDAKAGLVLHELVYRNFAWFDVETSRGIRYFTSVFSSEFADTLDHLNYWQRLRSFGVKNAHFSGLWLDVFDWMPALHDDGTLRSGFLSEEFEHQTISTPVGDIEAVCAVRFHQNGVLRSFYLGTFYGPVVTIGGVDYQLKPRRSNMLSCEERMAGHEGPDFFGDLSNLNSGGVNFVIRIPTLVQGENFQAIVHGESYFHDGKLLETQNYEQSADTWVVSDGRRMLLAPGQLGFRYPEGEERVLVYAIIHRGQVHIEGMSETPWIEGPTIFYDRAPYKVWSSNLRTIANVRLPYYHVSFKSGAIDLFESGIIESGRIVSDSTFVAEDDTEVEMPGGSLVKFTEEGKLRL